MTGAAVTGGKGGARRRKRRRGGPLFSVHWFRVVLDEAQSIKNSRTLASHASWSLQARACQGLGFFFFWGQRFWMWELRTRLPIICFSV